MIFFIDMIKLIIFLILPIFIYITLENTNIQKDNNLILKLTLILSIILFITSTKNIYYLLLINFPLLIALKNKYIKTYIFINLIIIFYLKIITNFSIWLITIYYLILLLILIFTKLKHKYFILINTYFYSFIIFYTNNKIISKSTVKLIIVIIINYLLIYIINKIISESISKYKTLEEQYRTQIFKFIHEVKNPITVCKGYIEIINKKQKNKKNNKNYIDIIDKSINDSLEIMEDYLSFGRFNVELDYMDITLLLEEIYKEYNLFMKENNINFTLNCKYDELIILGDYQKLKQVFKNMIKNSIEAKKEEKKLVINIKVIKKEKNIIIEIKDNGIGIKNLEKLGDKFYTTKKNGTGLGVNFSKKIIELHNGNIKYISNNNGTKVYIFFSNILNNCR